MQFYLDIDDVLAETTRAAHRVARERFGTKVLFEDMTVFDLRVSLELSAEQHRVFMQMVHEPQFLAKLSPLPGAVATLAEWCAGGAQIDLVTGRSPASRASTVSWLADHSISYHSLEFIDKYNRYADQDVLPLEALKGRHYDFAIEDSPSTAEYISRNTPSRVLLLDRPWNRAFEPGNTAVERVHDWQEILARVGHTHNDSDAGGR